VSEIRRPQRPIAEVVLRWLANDNRGNRLVYSHHLGREYLFTASEYLNVAKVMVGKIPCRL
jgi:hypothetical protein